MRENTLTNRVALITGASRGIGRSIALKLAQKKMKLVLCARSREDLQAVKNRVEAEGSSAFVIPVDLQEQQTAINLIKQTINEWGQLDILINNAGIAHKQLLADTTIEQWDLHMNVNARAPFILCREALPYLRKSEIPFIINIASVVAHKGYENQGVYSASKHALLGLTKVLARELADDDIRVHAISPGGVATDMVKKTRPDLDDSVLMKPEEIADIVYFLLTHRGNAVIDEIRVRRRVSTPFK